MTHNAENRAPWPLPAAYLRDDDTGFFFDCPRCHFFKNNHVGPCRQIGCGGSVERREFRVLPPAEETLTDVPDDAPPYRDAYEWTRVLPPAKTEGD